MSFANKVVIVTGASSGIGRDAALRLAGEGAKVVVFARREEELNGLVDEIKAAGGEALAVAGDATSLADNQRAVDAAVSTFGGLHGSFLNAGIYRGMKPIQDTPEEDIDAVIAVNIRGVVNGLKTHIPALLATGNEGAILVNSSTMGSRVKSTASAGSGYYSASKAFVDSIVQTAAVENAGKVRVNCVSPGFTFTPILGAPREQVDQMASGAQLIKRAADVSDISNVVVLLLDSSKAAMITGANFKVDGGWSLA